MLEQQQQAQRQAQSFLMQQNMLAPPPAEPQDLDAQLQQQYLSQVC